MKHLLASVFFFLAFLSEAHAQDAVWIETEGHAFVTSPHDVDSARRRALADALLNAALAGGAIVQGHTVVNLAVVERDLLIVRPMGRVMRHEIIDMSRMGDMWRMKIRAMVGNGGLMDCQFPNTLNVTSYRPNVRVSPYAPAWAEPLAADVVQTLYGVLDRHPSTGAFRLTDRIMPVGLSSARDERSYQTLTQGSVRLMPGDYGFIPDVEIDVVAEGRRKEVILTLHMALHDHNGQIVSQSSTQRSIKLAGPSIFGNAAVIAQATRMQMATDLTRGLDREFNDFLRVQSCTPLAARIQKAGNDLIVTVGKRHGLSRGAIAFTTDSNDTVEMLEIVSLNDRQATLRPMDPTRSLSHFNGRTIRFIEGGL